MLVNVFDLRVVFFSVNLQGVETLILIIVFLNGHKKISQGSTIRRTRSHNTTMHTFLWYISGLFYACSGIVTYMHAYTFRLKSNFKRLRFFSSKLVNKRFYFIKLSRDQGCKCLFVTKEK